jgi:hypothetical protein
MMLRNTCLALLLSGTLAAQKVEPVHGYAQYGVPALVEHLTVPAAWHIEDKGDIEQQVNGLLELPEGFSLRFDKDFPSLSQHHYRFTATYQGKAILFGNYHLAVDKFSGKVIFYNAPALPLVAPLADEEVKLPATAIQRGEKLELQEQVYYPGDGVLIPAIHIKVSGAHNSYVERVYGQNQLLMQRDLRLYHHANGVNDTNLQAYVFAPDPLTTAGKTYGAPYVDNNDNDVAVLQAERQLVNVTLTKALVGFDMENDACKLSDHGSPFSGITPGTTTNFLFNRSQSGFEDMMILYHIHEQYKHLHNLGFDAYPGYKIEVDPHGANGDDNSFFSPATRRLEFGEGGVDDAEDADVIIHEYNHALQFSFTGISPGSVERLTIEEALADYFTVSYSKSINPFNADKIFGWDGHNEYWSGREGATNKNYKQVSFGGNFYQHTDLLVAALSEILDSVGRNVADQIIWEGMFGLNSNTNMPQFAQMVLLADEALHGGQHYTAAKGAFVRYGILDANFSLQENPTVQSHLFAMDQFARGGAALFNMEEDATLTLYDVSGQLLREITYTQGTMLEIPAEQLRAGMYLLSVKTTRGAQTTHKLLRL